MSAQSSQTYLIKGDISGIQDFIFNVNSKGAARSLKGRSFFLKILLEVVMLKIFKECEILESDQEKSKISTSGGNFILIIEKDISEIIDNIQTELSNALQYTDLNMMLVCIVWQGNYKDTLIALNQKVRERKFGLLMGNSDFFEPFERSNISDVNGLPDKNRGENKKWHGLTDALRDNGFLVIQEVPGAKSILTINSSSLDVLGYRAIFSKDNIKGIPLTEYLESTFPIKQEGTYKDNDKLIKFEELSIGFYKDPMIKPPRNKIFIGTKSIDKLGILAMDVDNLGESVENVNSYVLHKVLDIKLKSFFNRELKKIINNRFTNQVYTVTAGGDDSFFVGKWDTMIDLAVAINNSFTLEFHEDNLTISAGLVIVHPNFPVVRFAELASQALKKAKYTYGKKGNICLLGEILDWSILKNEVLSLRKKFKVEGKELISSGLLAKARQTAVRISESEKEGIKLSDFWEMSYYMRNIKGEKHDKFLTKHQELMAKSALSAKKITDLKRKNELSPEEEFTLKLEEILKTNYRLVFPIAARLAELDNR